MLKPHPGGAMAYWPVDRRVGDLRNDNPDLFPRCANCPSAALLWAEATAFSVKVCGVRARSPRIGNHMIGNHMIGNHIIGNHMAVARLACHLYRHPTVDCRVSPSRAFIATERQL